LAIATIALIAVTEQRQLNIVEDARPAIWQVAMRSIAEHPWSGSGYGRLVNQESYALAFPDMGIRHAHNLILSIAEQSGVFAALALIALLIALAREYWRLYCSEVRAISLIGSAGLAMLMGVAAKNMTDMFFVRECALMFWSLNGVLLGYARRAETLSSPA
jgi:O-antigen ligase